MSIFKMLVGIPGGGKSTIAQQTINNDTVWLSSDNLREEMYGDANIKGDLSVLFNEMRSRAKAALIAGKDVIYDATNLNSNKRASFLRDLKYAVPGLRTECHLVLTPIEECIRRQDERDRKVPESEIMRLVSSFNVPGNNEPWDTIYVHNPMQDDNMLHKMISSVYDVEQTGPWHQETVGAHQKMVQQYAKERGFSAAVIDVAAYHDIGKGLTRTVDDRGHTHFYGHTNIGAYMYLCAVAPTGMLSYNHWYRAQLIEHHMDLVINRTEQQIVDRVGRNVYNDLIQLREADEQGAVRKDELYTMNVLKFMNAFDDWESRLSQPPYCVTVKRSGDYVLLKYQQLNSDFNVRVVQESRGSIFKKDASGQWQYVCRPFDKFFNYGEGQASDLDWNTARVLEKVDGSLMKVWCDDGIWHLSTNGNINAFETGVSDLGISFGDIFNRALGYDFQKLCAHLDPDYTYMFELTSPDSQIVIPYEDGVWYLSRRHNQTGIEQFDRPNLLGVKLPEQYPLTSIDDVVKFASKMSKDEEGFVVNDAQGNRIKVKSPEYLIAAHLNNNKMVSNRNLVIYMQEGRLDDFLAYCPQYKPRVDEIVGRFQSKCAELNALWNEYGHLAELSPKEFAAGISKVPGRDYLFQHAKRGVSAEDYLLQQLTPSLMRILGLKEDKHQEELRDEQETEEEVDL